MINLRRVFFKTITTMIFILGICPKAGSAQFAVSILAPDPSPAGHSAFVGSVNVTFPNMNQLLTSSSKVFYTLDKSDPDKNSLEYKGSAIVIRTTTTLKAIHIVTGIGGGSSKIVQFEFIRARLSAPIAKYGPSDNLFGGTNFYPTVLCTLQVEKSDVTSVIHYSLDNPVLNATSLSYLAPLNLNHTTLLRAYATPANTSAGYDNSDTMQLQFTLAQAVAAPTADPVSKSFASKSMGVNLKCATAGALIRYSLDTTANLDTCSVATGDSVPIIGTTAGQTIVLRAKAFKTGWPSSAVLTEKYLYSPQVATPIASRIQDFFYDTTSFTLSTATSGATVRYTLDNSAPTATSKIADSLISLTSTTTVKALAFKAPQPQSQIMTNTYTLRLTPPQTDHPSQQFVDELNVKLFSAAKDATIFYTLNQTEPDAHSPIYDPNVGITISGDTTVLTAKVIKGTVESLVSRMTYTKIAVIVNLAAPSITPFGRDFIDSLRITLQSGNTDDEIRYTLDGTNPTKTSSLYKESFLIDSSVTLRAQAFPTAGNFEPSIIREEKFSLLPSPPIPDINASAGPFQNQVQITLTTKTLGGIIYYTLGDQVLDVGLATRYRSGDKITFKTSTKIQAVTVLGTGKDLKISGAFVQIYGVYAAAPTDTLAAGASRTLSGGFTFTNSSTNGLLAKVQSSDALGIQGFRDAGTAIALRSIPTGQPLNVVFTKPTNQGQSLYRVENGVVHLITSDSKADLNVSGDYFVGIDTAPPIISMLSQTPHPGGSTSVTFSIKDNVAGPSCEITSPGLPGGKLIQNPDPDGMLTATFKNSGSQPKGLWFRAHADDFYNSTLIPKDPTGKVFLSQSLGAMTTPEIYTVGKPAYRWDMAGFPVSADAPMTWSQIRNANPDAELVAMVLQDSGQGLYGPLNDGDKVGQGMAFWLGSTKLVKSLSLPNFKIGESNSQGAYQMRLHQGWNQITDPALETLYWPFTHKGSKSSLSSIKGLYRFDPDVRTYVFSDSLEPWKGYFVYSNTPNDTVIPLYSNPDPLAIPKIAATQVEPTHEPGDGVKIGLGFGPRIPLILGADILSQDGFGYEDEPELPSIDRHFSSWSQRGKRRLSTDILQYIPHTILHWQIIVSDSSQTHLSSQADRQMHVLEAQLPAGYQAWAVSKLRGLKFRLEPGSTLDMEGIKADTLQIFAGPLEKLSLVQELSRAVMTIDNFSFKPETDPAGRLFVNLALPIAGRLDLSLWSLSGKLLSESHPGDLAQGFYRLPLGIGKNSQIGLLNVKFHGTNLTRNVTQKLLSK